MNKQTVSEVNNETIIAQTKKWITDIVVGLNFCPFAAREVKRDSIAYEVLKTTAPATVLTALATAMKRLDASPEIETLFLILPQGFSRFPVYLKLVNSTNQQITKSGYQGVYQVASFHPQYFFAGSRPTDPANYTNRSPYPMLQLLREESLSNAIASYPDTLKIPEKNIGMAKQKGLAHMQALLAACMRVEE